MHVYRKKGQNWFQGPATGSTWTGTKLCNVLFTAAQSRDFYAYSWEVTLLLFVSLVSVWKFCFFFGKLITTKRKTTGSKICLPYFSGILVGRTPQGRWPQRRRWAARKQWWLIWTSTLRTLTSILLCSRSYSDTLGVWLIALIPVLITRASSLADHVERLVASGPDFATSLVVLVGVWFANFPLLANLGRSWHARGKV